MKQKDLMQPSVLQQNRFFDNLPEQDITTYQLKKPSKKVPLATEDGETKQRRRKQTHKLSSFMSRAKPESLTVQLQLKAPLLKEEAYGNCEQNWEQISLGGMKEEENVSKASSQSIIGVGVEKVTNKGERIELQNQQKTREPGVQEQNKADNKLADSNLLKADEKENEKQRQKDPAQARRSINLCLSLDDSDSENSQGEVNLKKTPLEAIEKLEEKKKLKKVQYLRRSPKASSPVDGIEPACSFSSQNKQSNTQEQHPAQIENFQPQKQQKASQSISPVVSNQTRYDPNKSSKKPALLLSFDDEDDINLQSQPSQDLQTMQEICPKTNQEPQRSSLTNHKHQRQKNTLPKHKNPNHNNLLLNHFDDSQSSNSSESQPNSKSILLKPSSIGSSHSISSNDSNINLTRPINILQFSRMTSSLTYVYEPVPPNSIFQSIIKRYQKPNQNNVLYEMFDQSTYKSIIKVRKVPEGFEMFSTKETLTVSWDGNSKNLPKAIQETSCGLLCPNFFGTQFNCFKFNRNNQKPDCSKLHRLITVNYETNLFGLNGPRRMQAYVPAPNYLIRGQKSLQEAYESERQLKSNETAKIETFINRKPRWNSEISSFVLNFNGRATLSSVKNFIITRPSDSKKEPECEDNLVLFGKIQKNVFNLDIKYPFNLVQGLALALSSFDKKIGCE